VAGGRATTHPEEEEEEDDEEEEDWEGAGEAGGRPVLYVSAEETAGQVRRCKGLVPCCCPGLHVTSQPLFGSPG
jgi:hypothetical protein